MLLLCRALGSWAEQRDQARHQAIGPAQCANDAVEYALGLGHLQIPKPRRLLRLISTAGVLKSALALARSYGVEDYEGARGSDGFNARA